MSENQVFKTPTQPLDLPSKGKLYSKESPLSSGVIELNLPTAYHEDILTNRNYIQQGLVIDKFLQAIIATKIDYNELLVGDKNAIMVGARILAYGSNYSFKYTDPSTRESEEITVDLSQLKEKEIDWTQVKEGINEFDFTLPMSKVTVTFKILSHKDENNIEAELKGMQKISKNMSGDITVRLGNSIVAINGNRDQKSIRDFSKSMPMQDSQALRKYITSVTPDILMKFNFTTKSGEVVEGLSLPMTVDFFWPDLGV
jgi:hypothetical protein